jgi:DUF4097 and DUF4098 domain-containing protein YvlB
MWQILIVPLIVAAAPPQQQTDTTFSVDARGRLDVENRNGDVRVRSWDRNEVRIRARHGARTEIDIESRGSVVSVEMEGASRNAATHYDITVPRAFGITVDVGNGSVELVDVGGDIEVEALNGNIDVTGGTGQIDVESLNGEITIDGARGNIQASTSNQGIRILRSSGDISAETINGSIALTDIESANVEAESVNGAVDYAGTIEDGGRYELASHNGDLTITIPEGTNASVSVSTHNGSIQTDFPVQVREIRSRRHLSFTLGNGSTRIELESFGGSVRLRRPDSR